MAGAPNGLVGARIPARSQMVIDVSVAKAFAPDEASTGSAVTKKPITVASYRETEHKFQDND